MGALAAWEALPFSVTAFEAVIQGEKGAEAGLRAFRAGHQAALAGPEATLVRAEVTGPRGLARLLRQWAALEARVGRLPVSVQAMALAGLRKVVDFQDVAYGAAYLDRVEAVLRLGRADKGFALTERAAKYVTNAMCYDDVIRVADLTTRGARQQRIAREMGASAARVMRVTEYFHPRAEEIVGLLPRGLGARLESSPVWMARIKRWFDRGWHLRSDGMLTYGVLYVLRGMKGRRLRSSRHAQESGGALCVTGL